MSAFNKSYAQAVDPQGSNGNRGIFTSSSNQAGSASDAPNPQRTNSITIIEPGFSMSSAGASIATPSAGSLTSSPPHSRRPSLDPRRQSIAQVLSKISSRTSRASSEWASAAEPSFDEPIMLDRHETDKGKQSKKNKKIKSKQRRKRSTQTRDHGDFIASHGQGIFWRPVLLGGSTPLLKAISEGNLENVAQLIAEETLPIGKDGPNARALQEAALAGNADIVALLLESGKFDINARDSKERTALYAASSRGHDSVIKLLISKGARRLSSEELRIATQELKRWRSLEAQVELRDEPPDSNEQTIEDGELTAEPDNQLIGEGLGRPRLRTQSHGDSSEDGDHISKLALGSFENIKEMEEETIERRRRVQRRGDWVAGPILPSQRPPPSTSKGAVKRHKYVRYPGFGFKIPIVDIDFAEDGGHRVVSPTPTVDELLYGSEPVLGNDSSTSKTTCRWYHIPANHLGWAEDLIRKIYESRSPAEQKKRDVILAREPFYKGEYDHTDTTLLDPRPQARSLRPLFRNMTLDRDGNIKRSSALTMHMPFVHWETEKNRAEMASVMEIVRQGRKDDIDNEDGPEQSIPDFKTIAAHSDWSKNEKMLCGYLYNKTPVHPRRTLDQFYYHMLEDTEERDQDQVITRYYHNVWKRNHNAPEHDEGPKIVKPYANSHFNLALPHRDTNLPLVTEAAQSRTRFSVNMSESKLRKPVDAPPTGEGAKAEEKHVLMVDQLWLWILDDNTIISSFPENWTHDEEENDEKNSQDVLKSIHNYFTLVNRSPLESVNDLAQLIVYKCLAPFCKKSTPYGHMQILDVYESAIASVTDKESKTFAKFAEKSKKSRHSQFETPDPDEKPEDLYSIDEEIEQLKEIKDIRDELHILALLLENQTLVLDQAAATIRSAPDNGEMPMKSPSHTFHIKSDSIETGEVAPYSSENHFRKLHNMVIEQEKRREALETQAKAANEALDHLLDLKQKQANVSEARSARWTAESTKQQGNIMVLFTLVTIIFAPLSLMATMFSLQIVEFPDKLHMNFVLKYMFVVSIAVIVPLIGLVIYTTRAAIASVVLRFEKEMISPDWWKGWRWGREQDLTGKKLEREGGGVGVGGVDGNSGGIGGKEGNVRRRWKFWDRRGNEVVGKRVEDEEKGGTSVEILKDVR